MLRFLKYFVLEFAIIFIVGAGGYRLLNVPLNIPALSISAAVSGAIIAFAFVKTNKVDRCV